MTSAICARHNNQPRRRRGRARARARARAAAGVGQLGRGALADHAVIRGIPPMRCGWWSGHVLMRACMVASL